MTLEASSQPLEQPLEGLRPAVSILRRLLRRRLALLALSVIAAIYLAGILAPLIAPYPFNKTDFENTFAGPSLEHPLGTDRLGRDMLSRVIWSSQTTVIISVLTVATGGLALGVTLGLLAGYLGGRIDDLIMRLGDAFYSVPTILLLLIINATLGPRVKELFRNFEDWSGIEGIVSSGAPSYAMVFGALSLFGWVGMARLVRAQVLALRETDYILAARAAGAGIWRVIFRHLLPNVANIIVVAVTLLLGTAAAAEVALTWLGIGVQPPHPSFGRMIFDASGLTTLRAHPNLMLVPATVVAVLLLSFNLLGDALNDVLSPRRR